MAMKLCPAQQSAFNGLKYGLPIGNVFVLWGDTGHGKTTVLRELHNFFGGTYLHAKDLMDEMQDRHPLALEEAFGRLVMDALKNHDCVVVDDLHMLTDVVGGCSNYPRANLLEVPLKSLATYAAKTGKKLIFGIDHGTPRALL